MKILLSLYLGLIVSLVSAQKQEYYGPKEVEGFPHIIEYPCDPSASSRRCLEQKLLQHFQLFMRYPAEMGRAKKEGIVYVQLKWGKDGRISEVKARSQEPLFQKEAIRVFNELPSAQAAKLKGKNVGFVFSLPVYFTWPEDGRAMDPSTIGIEKVPEYVGCDRLTEDGKKDCFFQRVQDHLRKNFIYPEYAFQKEISGKISLVLNIGVDGRITISTYTSPHKVLTGEAFRLISLMPRIKPGYQDGKAIDVPIHLPITFALKTSSTRIDYGDNRVGRGYMGQNNRKKN
jgi:hypothetical protein